MAEAANDSGSTAASRTAREGDQNKAARERAAEAARRARERVNEATAAARDRANRAAEAARERGRRAADRGTALATDNPMIAIAGGVVIGAIIAGLLPRTNAEDRVAGNVGRKVRSQARKTVKNVKTNAKEQLDELGLSAEAAKDQLRGLAGKIGQVASDAAGGKGGSKTGE